MARVIQDSPNTPCVSPASQAGSRCLPRAHRDHVILQLLKAQAAVVTAAAVRAVEGGCGRATITCFRCILGAIAAETGRTGSSLTSPQLLSLQQVEVGGHSY